tara:strand:+ start:42 stop:197 length:156 start_codon:yes stop_codon:yes gene_type:complete
MTIEQIYEVARFYGILDIEALTFALTATDAEFNDSNRYLTESYRSARREYR